MSMVLISGKGTVVKGINEERESSSYLSVCKGSHTLWKHSQSRRSAS